MQFQDSLLFAILAIASTTFASPIHKQSTPTEISKPSTTGAFNDIAILDVQKRAPMVWAPGAGQWFAKAAGKQASAVSDGAMYAIEQYATQPNLTPHHQMAVGTVKKTGNTWDWKDAYVHELGLDLKGGKISSSKMSAWTTPPSNYAAKLLGKVSGTVGGQSTIQSYGKDFVGKHPNYNVVSHLWNVCSPISVGSNCISYVAYIWSQIKG